MEEFQCHLCQSIPNNPVILQCCLKSVCRDHISDCCPYCEISLSSLDLVPNRILESLLHLDQKTCERCENKPSQLRCKQCVANLCKDCSAHLHSLGVYRRHIVTPATHSGASDSEQRCTEHKLAFTYICTDEWRPICEKCIDDHEDHAVLAFDEVLEDALNEIDSKKEKIVSQMKSLKQSSNRVKESIETVEYNANQAKKGTAQTFKSIKQVLDWKEEELITEIENLKDRKSNQLKFSEESLQKEINKLENIVQYINTAKAESATTIFTNLSYLSHIIEQALENDYSQELMVDTDFECKVVVNSVQAAIEKLSFKEETYNSIAPSPKSNVNSFTKSPKPKDITNKSSYLKRSDRSETHLVKEKSDFTFTDDKRSSTPRTQGRMSTPTHFRDQSSFQSLDENPLEKRIFIKKLQTSSAIQVSWSHPPKGSSDLIYLLEYGVGTKIQNVEQFRQVYKGPAHTCIITDLLPKTSYRFRVSPSLQSSDDKGE